MGRPRSFPRSWSRRSGFRQGPRSLPEGFSRPLASEGGDVEATRVQPRNGRSQRCSRGSPLVALRNEGLLIHIAVLSGKGFLPVSEESPSLFEAQLWLKRMTGLKGALTTSVSTIWMYHFGTIKTDIERRRQRKQRKENKEYIEDFFKGSATCPCSSELGTRVESAPCFLQ